MTEETQLPPLPPVKIAFVIDGEVVDVMHTDERLAAILLSSPTIVDATGLIPERQTIVGWSYDGTEFKNPDPVPYLQPGETIIFPIEDTENTATTE